MTRDEIEQTLRRADYKVTPLFLDQVCKLIRIFEKHAYGISFDEEANAKSIVSLRDYKNQMLTGVTKTVTSQELEGKNDSKR